MLETDTFQSTRLRLEEWGLAERTAEINRTAAQLARRVADRYQAQDGRPRFVAGSIGPTGKLPSSDDPALSDITFDQLSDIVPRAGRRADRRRRGCAAGRDQRGHPGGQGRARRHPPRQGARTGSDVAVQAQVFLDLSGRMLLGTEIPAVIATLEAMPVDVIGLNCSTGPEHMREAIRVPVRALAPADLVHPQRRPAAGGRGRDGLPDGAGAIRQHPGRVRRRVWRERGRRLLRHAAGAYRHAARGDRLRPRATPREIEYIPSVSSGIRPWRCARTAR